MAVKHLFCLFFGGREPNKAIPASIALFGSNSERADSNWVTIHSHRIPAEIAVSYSCGE